MSEYAVRVMTQHLNGGKSQREGSIVKHTPVPFDKRDAVMTERMDLVLYEKEILSKVINTNMYLVLYV